MYMCERTFGRLNDFMALCSGQPASQAGEPFWHAKTGPWVEEEA